LDQMVQESQTSCKVILDQSDNMILQPLCLH